jgi:hypothetical protein
VDSSGKLYFVDHWRQRIYGWSQAEGLTVEHDHPLDPVNLASDKSGNLLVLSSAGAQGTVYSFRPGTPGGQMTEIAPQDTTPRPGSRAILPVNYWNNGEFANQLDFAEMTYKTLAEMFRLDVSTPKPKQYVSPDGSVFLPAARVFQQGPPDYTGWRFSDTLDAHGFVSAAAGERVYVSNESEDITYRATVGADGTLNDLTPFAPRGGECVAVDGRGNVYVANGQIFVYSPAGKQIGESWELADLGATAASGAGGGAARSVIANGGIADHELTRRFTPCRLRSPWQFAAETLSSTTTAKAI